MNADPVYVLTFHDQGTLVELAGVFADMEAAEAVAGERWRSFYFRPRPAGDGAVARWEAVAHGGEAAGLGDPWCRIDLRYPIASPPPAAVLEAERYPMSHVRLVK